MWHKLVETQEDGTEVPILDPGGLHIISSEIYSGNAVVALQIAQATRAAGKTAKWSEIK